MLRLGFLVKGSNVGCSTASVNENFNKKEKVRKYLKGSNVGYSAAISKFTRES